MPYCKMESEILEEMTGEMASGPPEDLFGYKYEDPWSANTAVLPFHARGPEGEVLEDTGTLEEGEAIHALWRVSSMTTTCRELGVKRVFGSYDGGGDENFSYYQGVELSDGRVIPASEHLRTMADLIRGEPPGIDYEELVDSAVCALMGHSFGIGPFTLRGVVIVDFDTCTITDEKNADVVLGDKMPWEV